MPSAPIMATNLPGNSWSSWRLRSSLITSPRLRSGDFARIDDDVRFEVQDALELAQRDVEQVADAARQALEEPDVRARAGEFDVAQTLAANTGQRDFDAALVADHAAVLHALVLAAQALPIGDRSEDAGAEQAVALRLEGAVVDGFGLGDFAVGPAADFFRGGQTDSNRIEIGDQIRSVVRRGSIHRCLHRKPLRTRCAADERLPDRRFICVHAAISLSPPPAPCPALRAASSSTRHRDRATAVRGSAR